MIALMSFAALVWNEVLYKILKEFFYHLSYIQNIQYLALIGFLAGYPAKLLSSTYWVGLLGYLNYTKQLNLQKVSWLIYTSIYKYFFFRMCQARLAVNLLILHHYLSNRFRTPLLSETRFFNPTTIDLRSCQTIQAVAHIHMN